MSHFLKDALGFLADVLVEHNSQTVTYRRGGLSVAAQDISGSSVLRVSDGGAAAAVRIERVQRDFILRAADLVLGGARVTPERGDLIDVDFGDVVERYEVTAPGKEPPYRHTDPYKTMLRIHAKYYGAV